MTCKKCLKWEVQFKASTKEMWQSADEFGSLDIAGGVMSRD